jgi:hypothetical protein
MSEGAPPGAPSSFGMTRPTRLVPATSSEAAERKQSDQGDDDAPEDAPGEGDDDADDDDETAN